MYVNWNAHAAFLLCGQRCNHNNVRYQFWNGPQELSYYPELCVSSAPEYYTILTYRYLWKSCAWSITNDWPLGIPGVQLLTIFCNRICYSWGKLAMSVNHCAATHTANPSPCALSIISVTQEWCTVEKLYCNNCGHISKILLSHFIIKIFKTLWHDFLEHHVDFPHWL